MHTLSRRVAAVMFTLWFALYVGVPQAVHPCPEHAAMVASMGGAEAEHDPARPEGERPGVPGDRGNHDAHGDHHAPAPIGAQAAASAGDADAGSHSHEECCCPGPQCGAVAMAVASPALAFRAPLSLVAAIIASATSDAPARRPSHWIPFATAPPAASIA